MINKRSIGTTNEQFAANYLKEQGYEILAMNYRCKVGEIDIIAKDKMTLVFVEVKYRSTERMGSPIEAVGIRKQNTIRKVCSWYLMENQCNDVPIRFDVIGILNKEIIWIKNAF